MLGAAVDLADAAGIDALTMRALAQELGVEAMSLYHHVGGKDDILEGIADLVVSEIELPAPGAEWKSSLRATAISAHEVFLRHRWGASLVLSATSGSGARLRYMEAILGAFREGGFSAEMTDHAYHALESHIMGFTLWEVGMSLGTAEELRALASTFLEYIDQAEFPYVVEHIHEHLKPRDPQAEGAFAFGLDLILDGLERIRGTRA